MWEPKAAAKVAATTGVIVLPTMPRAPETESMSGASGVACDMWFSKGHASVRRAFPARNPQVHGRIAEPACARERYTRPSR